MGGWDPLVWLILLGIAAAFIVMLVLKDPVE